MTDPHHGAPAREVHIEKKRPNWLKSHVRLVGYADARGSDAANARLGAERAAAVATALTSAGIAADRIATASGGDSNPVASNQSPSGQFQNRRTELVVTAK